MSLVLILSTIFMVVVMSACQEVELINSEELVPSEELASIEKWVKFDIKEPLPEGALFWSVSWVEENVTQKIHQNDGERISSFSINSAEVKIQVQACDDLNCIEMGETSLNLSEDKGRPLIESLDLKNESYPFKIQITWMTPPVSPSSSE